MDDAERGPVLAPAPMRVVERLAALGRDERRDHGRQRPRRAAEARTEVPALHALHREEHLVAAPPEIEHRDDVLVGEAHRQPGLAHEQVEEARIASTLGSDLLDHEHLLDATSAPPGEEHLGHAAPREPPHQLVATQRARHRDSVYREVDPRPVEAENPRHVRRALLLVVAVVGAAAPAPARAAPAADLVIVWAPGRDTSPLEAAARAAGAAMIDRSPAPAAPPTLGPMLQRAIDAYEELRLDEATQLLDQAAALADRTGAAGLPAGRLSDLFLYRGLVQAQAGNAAAAWDELVAAVIIEPTRVLDPVRFAPRVVDDVERARAAVLARPRATLEVEAPVGCEVLVDGTAHTPEVALRSGAHWVHVRCRDHAPWGARVEVSPPGRRVVAGVRRLAPPTRTEALVQARAAGARATIVIEVAATTAIARVLGTDGAERDRRTIVVGDDLGPVASALRQLLAPAQLEVAHRRWYHARWVWAAGAAVLAAAVLVPITAAVASDREAPSVTVRWPAMTP